MHLKKMRHHFIDLNIILALLQHDSFQTTDMTKTVTLAGSWGHLKTKICRRIFYEMHNFSRKK